MKRVFVFAAILLAASVPAAAQKGPAPTMSHLPADVLALACSPTTAYGAPDTPLRLTGGQDSVWRRNYAPGDLVTINAGIVSDVVRKVLPGSPKAILIVVSNPLDAMCEVARRVSGLPRERVFGMAGILDSARMRWFLAEALNVSVESTHAFVLGGHGDTMVPLPRYSTVGGVPVTELLPRDKLDAIVKRTRDGGAEIVNLLKTSAWYAPSAAVVEMVDSVLRDKKKILPCAAYLQGEYGMSDVYLGVPVKLGAKGVEQIVEIALTAEEKAALEKSAGAVRELFQILKV